MFQDRRPKSESQRTEPKALLELILKRLRQTRILAGEKNNFVFYKCKGVECKSIFFPQKWLEFEMQARNFQVILNICSKFPLIEATNNSHGQW